MLITKKKEEETKKINQNKQHDLELESYDNSYDTDCDVCKKPTLYNRRCLNCLHYNGFRQCTDCNRCLGLMTENMK